MKKVNLIRVFIASPGDVIDQREEVEKLITQWNNENTKFYNVILMPIRWENNAFASYRENQDGQTVINEQILEDSDILIAIFGHKLGQKTMAAESGTVEEINYFYKKNKRGVGIFFYETKDIPIEYIGEYSRVIEYKNKLQEENKGMYDTFDLAKIRVFLSSEIHYLTQSKIIDKDSEKVLQENLRSPQVIGARQADIISEKINIIKKEKLDNLEHTDNLIIFNEIEYDEDERLLLIFIAETMTKFLGARWRAEETIKKIKDWEEANEMVSFLSENYELTLPKLEEKEIIYPCDYTSHGNPREFTLKLEVYKKLKMIIRTNSQEVLEAKNRKKLPRDPFEI